MHLEVHVTSDAELEAYLAPLLPKLRLKETEDSWFKINEALVQFQSVTKGGGARLPSYVALVRDVAPCIIRSLLSERTKLSGTASDVLNSMAPRLGDRFAAFLPTFMPPLLQLCARTNKVALKRAEKSIHLICRHCQLSGTIPFLVQALHEKAAGLRAVALGALIVLVEASHPERLQKRVQDLEQVVRIYARDPNSEVRSLCRTLYAQYTANWPERQCTFAANLSPTSHRYLGSPALKPVPKPGTTTLRSTSREEVVNPLTKKVCTAEREIPRTKPKEPVRLVSRTRPVQPLSRPATSLHRSVCAEPSAGSVATPHTSTSGPACENDSPISSAQTLLPPPPRFSAPSEGVAYRLALAQEEARARSKQGGESRTRSRAFLPSATGGARRVQVGKAESSPPQSASFKSSVMAPNALHLNGCFAHAQQVANVSSPPKDHGSKQSTPNTSPSRSQFTPQRRPFGIVNDVRTHSPQVGNFVQ